ncbi:MAG: hypothetical protein IAE91_15450 [Ignavibacteriaceae bacterium]|nr:hypothetical protein [Ignavibacteriaceae bacterium]
MNSNQNTTKDFSRYSPLTVQNYLLTKIIYFAVSKKYRKLEKLFSSIKGEIQLTVIYECILQTYLFAGYPSALNSLKIFNNHFGNLETLPPENQVELYDKGLTVAEKIYGDRLFKLIKNIEKLSPSLSRWFISEGYGKVFSREGVSLQEREITAVVCLCVLEFEEQLISHLRGSIRTGLKTDDLYKMFEILEKCGGRKAAIFGIRALDSFLAKRG